MNEGNVVAFQNPEAGVECPRFFGQPAGLG